MYDDFDKIHSIVDLNGVITNLSPLRVGTGREANLEAATDLSVYRVGEKIVIPGSSIKGMLRSFAESLLRAQGVNIHDPWEFVKISEEFKKRTVRISPA